MKRRSLLISLLGIILIAVVALGATVVAGRSPLLGLDLRGGVEVVLQPAPHQKITDAKLQTAVDIIDRRVDKIGVANSTVERQGNDVVIELPGTKNAQSDIKTLGQTAQLYFRPVICDVALYQAPPTSTSTSKSTSTTKKAAGAPVRADLTASTSSTSTSTTSTSTDKTKYLQNACGVDVTPNPLAKLANGTTRTAAEYPTTGPLEDNPDNTVIVTASSTSGEQGYRWVLGPADLKGGIVKTAAAGQDSAGDNVVNVTLTSKGLTAFNKIAKVRNSYYVASSTTGQSFKALEAIDLDGQLESAPSIDVATFTGPIQISGSFTSGQASALATDLEYGSLPLTFTIGNVDTVSASLGHASLRAGLLAGLGGIVLVLLYMILYYRALGLVVVLGLGVGGALLYSILTELSYTSSLALTLSGITGVIVSIGITVDSYVVYFERLKDEVRQGRTVRSSVERGFTRAFKTVLTADLVSFMAALILYLFTVGDVKGFAFTLGLSTLLDVFTAYFFIRPIVVLLGRRRTTSESRFLGIARGLGAVRAEAAT